MITETIKEAIIGKKRSMIPGFVYVVRDDSTVFYVGMSNNPSFRLCQHLGIADAWNTFTYSRQKFIQTIEEDASLLPTFIGASQVGTCIMDNAPESLMWSFDIYETEDAIAVLARAGLTEKFPRVAEIMKVSWYEQRSFVENALIDELKPYLNSMMNRHERSLPSKYRNRRVDLDDNAVDYLHIRRREN